MTRTSSRAAVLVVTALVAVASCGGDDDGAEPAGVPSTSAAPDGGEVGAAATPAATASPGSSAAPGTTAAAGDAPEGGVAATDAPGAGAATLATAESDLGEILVDQDGMTLYVFLPDEQGPSTCEAECLAAWPSVPGPARAGEGVDEALMGVAARPDDGSDQVTYDGWPLYTFAQDTAPGDVTGQGIGDVWYVVGPDGSPIGA